MAATHSSRNEPVGGAGRQRAGGGSREAGRCGHQLAQLVRRQLRDLANAVSGVGHVPQQVEPVDVALGIEAAIGGGPVRLDGAVALLPDPNDVGAQPGEPGDQLNGILSFVHILPQNIHRCGRQRKPNSHMNSHTILSNSANLPASKK